MVQWNWLHPEAFIKVTNTKWQGLFWFIIGENCTYLKCCIYIRFRDYPSWYDIWAFFFYEIFFLHILHSPLYHNFCLKRNLFETRKQSNFNWKQENCFLPVFLEFSNIFFFNLHWIAWLRLLTIIINILHVLVWNHIYSNLKYNNRGGKLLKKNIVSLHCSLICILVGNNLERFRWQVSLNDSLIIRDVPSFIKSNMYSCLYMQVSIFENDIGVTWSR